LLKVTNDVIMSAFDQHMTVFVSCHFSTFDTISHGILLEHISPDFGIQGNVFSWLCCFVSDQKQRYRVMSAAPLVASSPTNYIQAGG